MKRKEEETVTPDSANISDMQTNDDEDERTESRERSKGKRRTAREIANMFEQLKQRHIARKQEWQKEKEDLVKKVQTADESKKILADLKFVLENLRKELKLEERKRLDMEKNYQDEKFSWLSEKDYLLQRIEESTIESEEGAEVSALTEKICEQSRELSILQDDLLQLKKSLLEKENVFLREKRELEIQLEKERAAWKKKESSLTERIKLLDSKSGISSASAGSPLISPAATPHPPDYEAGSNGKYLRRKSSAVSIGQETSEKYNVFQQTVDDALKQIDKISKDLIQIEEPRPGRSLTPLQASQLFLPESSSSTPSPRRLSSTLVDHKNSNTHDPSVNAPWRTKRRTSSARHPNEGNQSIVHPETTPQNQDKDTLQPAANKAQVRIIPDSRSPIPDRKVKKIDRQGSKVDVILSSPDANHSDTSRDFVPIARLQNIPDPEQPSDTSSNPDFASTAVINDSTRRHRLMPRDDTVKRFSPVQLGTTKSKEAEEERQLPVAKIGRSAHLPQDIASTEFPRENDSVLGMKNDENVTRSNSPRLPKLHQQLLFKRELTKGREEEIQTGPKPSAISRRTSHDNFVQQKQSPPTRGRRNTSHDSCEQNKNQAHSRYFNPSFGHIAGSRKNKDTSKTPSAEVQDPSSKEQTKEPTKPTPKVSKVKSIPRQHIGGALVGLGTALISGEHADPGDVPPVTQPKPKVFVHKDAQGKIVRVSPEIPLKEQSRKSISPECQASEKYNSIAGRVGSVGKAGRDWIMKKFSFKEKKDDEIETEGKSRPTTVTPSTGDTHEENKRRGRSKPRGRPSSLLRNGSRRSLNVITSTDESNDSGREEKKRESFLRRNRRKSKKNGDADRKADSPAKSKPKKYTRSKTDTSTEMRQFLSKFKASQGNPKKPSIVKQFERRLLENEVKTLEDDKSKIKQTQDGESLEKEGKVEKSRQRSLDEGYSGEDEEDNESVKNAKSICQEKFSLPNIVPTNDNLTQRKPKQGPPVKSKPYYRRSMSDFNILLNGSDVARSRENKKKEPLAEDIEEANEFPKISPSQRPGVQEAVEVCGKRGVSSLVDRFSTLSEKGGSETSQIARGSTNRNSLRNQTDDTKWNTDNAPVQRSRSMSYRGQRATNLGNNSKTGVLTSSPINAEKSKYDKTDDSQNTITAENTGSHSWRDRVMSKPLDSESNDSLPLHSGSRMASDTPSYLPTPPSEHDSKRISWSANLSGAQNIEKSPKPGRMKMMSEEMRRKADVIEKALLHGPKKVRRYRRADTQPIGRSFTSSDEEDSTESDIDFTSAFRPVKKVPDHSNEEEMHRVIPRVTTKFDKPSKPGRMPSRWAR